MDIAAVRVVDGHTIGQFKIDTDETGRGARLPLKDGHGGIVRPRACCRWVGRDNRQSTSNEHASDERESTRGA